MIGIINEHKFCVLKIDMERMRKSEKINIEMRDPVCQET